MGAHFSKVAMCFSVFMLFVGILEIAVLPAWELNSDEINSNNYDFLVFL